MSKLNVYILLQMLHLWGPRQGPSPTSPYKPHIPPCQRFLCVNTSLSFVARMCTSVLNKLQNVLSSYISWKSINRPSEEWVVATSTQVQDVICLVQMTAVWLAVLTTSPVYFILQQILVCLNCRSNLEYGSH